MKVVILKRYFRGIQEGDILVEKQFQHSKMKLIRFSLKIVGLVFSQFCSPSVLSIFIFLHISVVPFAINTFFSRSFYIISLCLFCLLFFLMLLFCFHFGPWRVLLFLTNSEITNTYILSRFQLHIAAKNIPPALHFFSQFKHSSLGKMLFTHYLLPF